MRYAVFFNLQKAFNSVPHQALLAKLHTLGVDNFLLKWICHWLFYTLILDWAHAWSHDLLCSTFLVILVLESQYMQFMQEVPHYSKFEVHEMARKGLIW